MELMVALDYPEVKQAAELADQLRGLPVTYKIGSELFLQMGLKGLHEFKKQWNASLFLDLKFHDIPNTVSRSIAQLMTYDLKYVTMHLSGGRSMMEASRQVVDQSKSTLQLLGVSVLTSFDEAEWKEVAVAIHPSPAPLADTVSAWVALGAQSGIHGVVCSGHEVSALKKAHPTLKFIIPGVRPDGFEKGPSDQKRVLTPSEVKKRGGDAIVVGRPITQNEQPKKIVEAILRDC